MAGNHVLLETISLTQTASSVTFDNIPQTGYTDLKIVASSRSNRSNAEVEGSIVRFNGDNTSGNYSVKRIYGSGSSVSSDSQYAILWGAGNTATANCFGNSELYITNAFGSTAKSFSSDSVQENNGSTAYSSLIAGLWTGTSSITSISIAPEIGTLWLEGTTFSLYGLAALNTTPAVAPKATGGNIVANDGTYWYHAFTTSGNFVPQTNLTCNALVIAGGGGGGVGPSGGAGAGGLLAHTSQSLTATSYTVVVGSGGSASGYNTGGSRTAGTQGSNSQFASLTASLGGGYSGNAGSANGGSGGGQSDGQNIGLGTSGQGNNGGSGTWNTGTGYAQGGGGGAGAVGGNGSGNQSGAGGAGSSAYSSWGAATTTGQNVSGTYWFAGGGGGGGASWTSNAFPATALGAGGNGGGGSGGPNNTSTGNAGAGIANTGGGGGGGGYYSTGANNNGGGGAGGSGIVIIRYAMA